MGRAGHLLAKEPLCHGRPCRGGERVPDSRCVEDDHSPRISRTISAALTPLSGRDRAAMRLSVASIVGFAPRVWSSTSKYSLRLIRRAAACA